jgi:hypothetical protein
VFLMVGNRNDEREYSQDHQQNAHEGKSFHPDS